MTIEQRWLLSTPPTPELEPIYRDLVLGRTRVSNASPVPIQVWTSGRPLDMSFAVPMGVLVVSARIGAILERSAPEDVQLIEARVGSLADRFYVIKILSHCDCLDETRSELGGYTAPGQFIDLIKPVLDASRAQSHQVFRLASWHPLVAVSEVLKLAIENIAPIGPSFTPLQTI
jgi:hypothetical protein